jgi:hypothetical protein
MRIRKNVLKVSAFALAGMNINRSSGVWDWNSILEGLDRFVQLKLDGGGVRQILVKLNKMFIT